MTVFRVELNGNELLCAGGEQFGSMQCDLVVSLLEEEVGLLTLSGLRARKDGLFDTAYWLESEPLQPGDRVGVTAESGTGGSPPKRWHTHEELEALRLATARAEAAGEYELARSTPRPLRRSRLELVVAMPGQSQATTATPSSETITCAGIWSDAHRAGEWQVRMKQFGREGVSAPAQEQWLAAKFGRRLARSRVTQTGH